MAKDFLLHCKDIGNDCEKKFTGYNEGEVLMKCIQHIMWKIRSTIKNNPQ